MSLRRINGFFWLNFDCIRGLVYIPSLKLVNSVSLIAVTKKTKKSDYHF